VLFPLFPLLDSPLSTASVTTDFTVFLHRFDSTAGTDWLLCFIKVILWIMYVIHFFVV
jgi:hypothetical protein